MLSVGGLKRWPLVVMLCLWDLYWGPRSSECQVSGLGVSASDVSVQPVILVRAGGYIVFFLYPPMLPWHRTCFIVSAHMTCPQGLAAFSLLEPGS